MAAPDSFMPMYWADFWEAVDGQPDYIIVGYQRALSNYWGHTHCAGIEDDDERMRRICRIERDQWEDARAVIFDNFKFFTMGEDGRWHQKRAAQEWQIAKDKYDKACKRSAAGNEARWGRKGGGPPRKSNPPSWNPTIGGRKNT